MEAAKACEPAYLIVFLPLLCNRLLKINLLFKRALFRPCSFAFEFDQLACLSFGGCSISRVCFSTSFLLLGSFLRRSLFGFVEPAEP
jgi:hypothetical protein